MAAPGPSRVTSTAVVAKQRTPKATAAVAKWEGQLTLEDQSLDRGIGTTPLPAE